MACWPLERCPTLPPGLKPRLGCSFQRDRFLPDVNAALAGLELPVLSVLVCQSLGPVILREKPGLVRLFIACRLRGGMTARLARLVCSMKVTVKLVLALGRGSEQWLMSAWHACQACKAAVTRLLAQWHTLVKSICQQCSWCELSSTS